MGGQAALYIPGRPEHEPQTWARQAAENVLNILELAPDVISSRRQLGYQQAAKFDAEQTLNAYERIYQQAVESVQV